MAENEWIRIIDRQRKKIYTLENEIRLDKISSIIEIDILKTKLTQAIESAKYWQEKFRDTDNK